MRLVVMHRVVQGHLLVVLTNNQRTRTPEGIASEACAKEDEALRPFSNLSESESFRPIDHTPKQIGLLSKSEHTRKEKIFGDPTWL